MIKFSRVWWLNELTLDISPALVLPTHYLRDTGVNHDDAGQQLRREPQLLLIAVDRVLAGDERQIVIFLCIF
jgi:hypothetical protein